MATVDVVSQLYGKPYMTAVTLVSLLQHSGHHINKIFLGMEKTQPPDADFSVLLKWLGSRADVYTPAHFLGCGRAERDRFPDTAYRRSLRYQYGWEKSRMPFLFVTHNDVLYTGDIVGALLDNIDEYIGIGQIGQCWNCPASFAGVCDGRRYHQFRPSHQQLLDLANRFPPPRGDYAQLVDPRQPWPLPECRLNEWVALINLQVARLLTLPLCDATPLGAMGIDIGSDWFRDLSVMGYVFRHYDFDTIADHAWTKQYPFKNGRDADLDHNIYLSDEDKAKAKLQSEFGWIDKAGTLMPPDKL